MGMVVATGELFDCGNHTFPSTRHVYTSFSGASVRLLFESSVFGQKVCPFDVGDGITIRGSSSTQHSAEKEKREIERERERESGIKRE